MQRINLFLMVLCFLAITNKANAWTGSGTAASPWLIGDSSTNTVSAVKAKLQGDTLLTIFGTGNMADFPYSTEGQTPWRQAGKHTLIKTVVIESGVTNIGDIAFQDCSNLQWITIPEGVTIIGTRAFENCVSLSAVSIPNTATTIESQAFKNCTDLISVNNNANIPQSNVASNAFSGVTVSNVYLTVPLAPLNDYKQATVWRNFNVKSQYVRFTENLGNDVDEMIVDPDGTLYYYQYRDAAHTIPLKLIIHNKANDSHPTIVTYNESGLPSTITTKNSTVLFDNYEENHCSVTQISANSINESVLQISGWWSEIQDMWDTPLDKTNNILSLVGTALSFVDNGGFVSMDPQLGAITALVEFAGLDEMCPALKPIITGINVLGTVIDCGVAYFSGETNILADVQCALGIWNLAVTIYNARHQNSDIKTWNYDWNYSLDYGVLTIYGTGVMTQPSGGYPWANRKSEITKLIIRSGVTSIPRSAFSGCDNLTTVTIEAGSDTLYVSDSYSTFYNTPIQTLKLRRNIKDTYGNNFTGFQKTTLTSLEIGNQVTFIDNSMFSGCTGLTSVNIPTSVKSIGSSAFSGCTNLKTLTIGNKVTSIGNHAFDNTALTDLTIPSSVKEIGSYAFDGCKFDNVRIENSTDTLSLSNSFFGSTRSDGGIKSLYLGRNISYSYTITGSPFDSDTLLVSVTMGDNVTYIGRNFFNGCKNLKTVSLSSNITSIGYRAFYGCSSLSSIDIIPLTVTSIGDYAFNNCKEIKSLVLPASVTEIGYNAFSGCTNLQSVKTDMTFIPNNIFSGCTNLKTLTIGNKVTSIGNNAFNNTALTDLTIPSSVKEIGFSAFGSCKFDNVRIENSTDTLSLSGSFLSGGTSRSDGGIKSLYLGRNISYTGFNSSILPGSPFESDTLLVSVTMGDNVTYIGSDLFYGCKNLKTVSLSSNITSIGYRAFYGCSNLSQIISKATIPPKLSNYTFYNVPTNIPVYVPCGAYTNYRDAQYWSSFTNFVDYCTQVTPAETSAVISWTAIENTEYYKIAVYADEAHTQVIGQYRVDATGNITRLRNTTEQNELSLSVTNLSASTPYSFTITAYGNNNTEVVTFSGDFTTLSNDIAYIVTFDSRGGSSVSSQQITSGQRVSEPTAPTKSGYNFGGWYRESSCTNVWNFNNDVITSNVMLYAKWTPTSYIVVYNGNGNTGGSTSSSTHTYDVAKNLTANGFTKTGYAFAGWATSATGSVEYSNGQSVSNLTAANNGTVNLYAKWTLTTVAVTGVTLNQNTASLIAGNTLQLTETVLPSNASDKSRTWSSSNISVASVNSSGLVTAKSAGSATITLTTRDGGKKATCVVTVSSPSLTLSSTAYNFIAGGGTSPAITVTSNVSWTVSDDATWIITSKTNGSNNSTFTMTAEANTAIFPRSATITVTGGGITKTISVTQNAALLPVQNYQVKTTNCTCRGTDDGAIDISFNKSLNYTVKVTGNNYSKTDTATSNYHLSGLAAGTYTVAITISGLTGYQQDFTVVVSQPESLNVLKADVATGTAQYVMSGGETYHITVNGITRTTRSNTVEIPLQNGENRISIRTEKSCQGVYEETVFFNGQITLFPNPADVQVTISIPGEDEQVTVEIFSMSGSRQYKEKLTVSSDRLVHINVSGYSSGTYLVKVSGATIQDIVRMVKK
ncbi:leucine-rich repeat protein [Dysgonomonas sp. GY75]|uniref:leucine-rich repeat protein n=1 Tax=Dysgonomonas sp. GY75 TaxID=2780419 RepID=UPI00188324FA|nr:leucine-rich repeat protein [Dysgonomonas sp. GY75]MBF0651077.1 leucine-rich repeat protein [Dysgonomonas sp. GY75]